MGICLVLGSCQTGNKQEIEAMDQKIMAIHDEVMPRIGEVLSLRKQVQAKMAEVCKDAACTDTFNALSYALTKADADMMHWMRNYRKPEGADTALVYLQTQMEEIEKVKAQILFGINHSKAFLDSGYQPYAK